MNSYLCRGQFFRKLLLSISFPDNFPLHPGQLYGPPSLLSNGHIHAAGTSGLIVLIHAEKTFYQNEHKVPKSQICQYFQHGDHKIMQVM